jgi:AmmeMemoRadiSam system protein B/AmmeMemoRadiSam system protein A
LSAFIFIVLIPVFLVSAETEKVRDFLTTGPWYPRSRTDLSGMMDRLFAAAGGSQGVLVRALVSPHAGFAYSGLCAARGYIGLKGRKDIRRVIILGSAHRVAFRGACVSDFTHNATPLGKIELDRVVIQTLARETHFRVDDRIMQHEHSIENQLPFLQYILPEGSFRIVPILFGRVERREYPVLAAAIGKHVDRATLVVASSDLNHYGRNFDYAPFAGDPEEEKKLTALDRGMIDPIIRLDTDAYFAYEKKTGIKICGLVPVGVLLHLYPPDVHGGRQTCYSKSGDRNGDYSLSVSYLSAVVFERRPPTPSTDLSRSEKKALLHIARRTLEGYLSGSGIPGPDEWKNRITPALRIKTGVFVTLKSAGRLRGCIGSLVGQEPLHRGVVSNAVRAAVEDPRFAAVTKAELPGLHIEISVMTPPRKITDHTKIRLGTDGVILKQGYRQAVYLPQVATETGWGIDEFLSNLSRKAGLPAKAYLMKGTDLYVFQAQVFGEGD